MRVLHVLIAPGGEPATPAETEALLCRAAVDLVRDAEHTVAFFGNTTGEIRLRELGLSQAGRLPAPVRRSELGLRGLRRFTQLRGSFDVAHVWSPSAEPVVRELREPMRVITTVLEPIAGGGRVNGDVAAHSPVRFVGRGFSIDAPPPKPPIEATPRTRRPRSGATPLSIAMLSDPPIAGDAYLFMHALGLAHFSHRSAAGVIARGSWQERRGSRLHDGLGRAWSVRDSEGPALIGAQRAGVAALAPRAIGPHPSPTPALAVLWAKALGVVVLNERCTIAPAELGREICDLCDHPRQLTGQRSAIRKAARSLLDDSGYASALRRAWGHAPADATIAP